MLFSLLTLGLGLASVHAEDIPDGIMPKRQVVGTGGTTTTTAGPTTSSTIQSTTTTPTSSSPTTTPPSTTSTPPTTTPTTSSAPPTTTAQPPTTSTTPTSQTSPSSSQPSSSQPSSSQPSSSISSQAPPSSVIADPSSITSSTVVIPTTEALTTTDSRGSIVVSSLTTSRSIAISVAPSSTPAVRTQSGKASSLVVIGSSTFNRATLSQATTITSPLVALETLAPSTFTSYWTSDGSVFSKLVTTTPVITATTGFATATLTPSLQNGGGNGSNLSTSSKKIVGGVVGGIGGAILIGGIAIVAWRLWGKKKREAAEPDPYLDSRDDSIRHEKRQSQGLQSMPETYQNPNGVVNTASNF